MIPAARASGAGNTRVRIEKEVLALLNLCLLLNRFLKIKQRFSKNMLNISPKNQTARPTKPVKGTGIQLPTTVSEQTVPKPERKVAKSAE